MEKDIVTIIIATYNRPDVLKTAIKSVVNQTVKNWKLLVIGDCCDARTGEVVLSINDKRIRYINLQERFGEQSGPNSIGMALADTPYISFLNHDDLWLSDHLESGISVLKKSDYDFYIGGTAFTVFLNEKENSRDIPVDLINTGHREVKDFFTRKLTNFEPASSWIIKSSAAEKIGHWNYYSDIYRFPAEDFLLRSHSLKIKFCFSKKLTVWNFQTQNVNVKNDKRYSYQSLEHQLALELLETIKADDLRMELSERLKVSEANEVMSTFFKISLPKRVLKGLLYNRYTFSLFEKTKIDVFRLVVFFRFQRRGGSMRGLILRRTGQLPQKPDKEELIRNLLKSEKG